MHNGNMPGKAPLPRHVSPKNYCTKPDAMPKNLLSSCLIASGSRKIFDDKSLISSYKNVLLITSQSRIKYSDYVKICCQRNRGYKTTLSRLVLSKPPLCVLLTLQPQFSNPITLSSYHLSHHSHALSNCIFFTHNSKIEFVTEFGNISIIPIKIKGL